jgi:hypothetical protein
MGWVMISPVKLTKELLKLTSSSKNPPSIFPNRLLRFANPGARKIVTKPKVIPSKYAFKPNRSFQRDGIFDFTLTQTLKARKDIKIALLSANPEFPTMNPMKTTTIRNPRNKLFGICSEFDVMSFKKMINRQIGQR